MSRFKFPPVLVVLGPTGSGKSGLACELARQLGGEIVSADAFQIYRGFDIGTNKQPDRIRKSRVNHHLLDICDPGEKFTAFDYQQRGRAVLETLFEQGRLPVITGGTNLYVKTLLYDYRFKRPFRKPPDLLYPTFFVSLKVDRAQLYNHLDGRVEKQLAAGLIKEVQELLALTPHSPGYRGIGYKEVIGYLKQEYDQPRMKELLQAHNRNYAKRQITWLRHQFEPHLHWYEAAQPDLVTTVMTDFEAWKKTNGF